MCFFCKNGIWRKRAFEKRLYQSCFPDFPQSGGTLKGFVRSCQRRRILVFSPSTVFSMQKCASAIAAIWGRWVMHKTWYQFIYCPFLFRYFGNYYLWIHILQADSRYSMQKCASAIAAIWGRWVMHKTWCLFLNTASFSETFHAVFPLIPASISSKTKVPVLSLSAKTLFKASMIRDNSPPDILNWHPEFTKSGPKREKN